MKRILSWILGIPVALFVIVVAVANRRPVVFSLDPFEMERPWFSVEMPLYALLVATIILGMLIGGTSAWISQGKWRREARLRRQEVRRLESERDLSRAQTQQQTPPVPRTTQVPAPLHPV
ncbi:LapA family protein [Rhodoligotrophos defluvii]|uniref:LapA family protein n=1 Tax=Rhodoligotrophos defluvii TaxID=2561934 RepID=UPI001EF01EBD|nr:LapA family protein [Rhodoligotrophos defluvii]